MDLSHNIAFRILSGEDAGIYRVVLNEVQINKVAVVRLDPLEETRKAKGGRKRLEKTKKPRKKERPPMLGTILWMDRNDLYGLKEGEEINVIEVEQENYLLSESDNKLYKYRKEAMAPFLSFDHFREMILIHNGFGGLVNEAVAAGNSDSFVRNNLSQLCRYGFDETSLRPTRSGRCGAPGEPRPCDPGGRKKSGRKTEKQRIARRSSDIFLEPEQPGMSSLWRAAIIAADKRIPAPKPDMPERVQIIVDSAFVKRFRQEDGKLVLINPKLGDYPNPRQIRRVLEKSIPKLQRLLERTTKGHFKRSLRGLVARNWKGVVGPGHTWAIDSSIGDVYLRSSVNRAWIIGRPVVYVIVDVW